LPGLADQEIEGVIERNVERDPGVFHVSTAA
jgi:hypothetical protein